MREPVRWVARRERPKLADFLPAIPVVVFAGLWYGKNLAYTIAVLTVLAVLVVRFTMLTNPTEDEAHGGDSSGSRPAGAG